MLCMVGSQNHLSKVRLQINSQQIVLPSTVHMQMQKYIQVIERKVLSIAQIDTMQKVRDPQSPASGVSSASGLYILIFPSDCVDSSRSSSRRSRQCLTDRHCATVQRRTWNGIACKRRVQIEQNTWICCLHQSRPQHSAGQLIGASTCDGKVEALRVVLCSIGLASSMQC